MMPKAKIDIFSRAPPENILNRPRKLPEDWLTILPITAALTPGVVTNTPIRYTAKSASVVNKRRRSSGIFVIFWKPEAI